jgi:hypothetical protein
MEPTGETDEVSVTADIGERLRTWRMFIAHLRWFAVATAALLIALLIFRTHG